MANLRKIYYTYSKKQGMIRKTMILLKDVSFEECVEYAKKNYNVSLTKEKTESAISGLLAPGKIKITGKL